MVPEELTTYIKDRQGYDYSHHGRADNPDTAFVPDEIVDRFCLFGPAEAHIEKLKHLRELGVGQFAVCDMHDNREGAIDAYGSNIIPALRSRSRLTQALMQVDGDHPPAHFSAKRFASAGSPPARFDRCPVTP